MNSPETVPRVAEAPGCSRWPPSRDQAAGAYYSAASFDLTGSAFLLHVPQTASTTTHAQTYVSLDGPAGDQLTIIEEDGQIYFRYQLAGTNTDVSTVLYDSTQHAWWKISESGGTISWETAPDGKAWTMQAQHTPLPFAITALDVEIGSETYLAQASPGVSHFAACNLPPP